jgi:hypothetical protein
VGHNRVIANCRRLCGNGAFATAPLFLRGAEGGIYGAAVHVLVDLKMHRDWEQEGAHCGEWIV